ncbi:hypothetical protein GCM10027167_03130 [Nocardia heshunensis]
MLVADHELINKLLTENGLPAHQEPRVCGPATEREHEACFSYGMLHHLRYAYAHAVTFPDKPLPLDDSDCQPSGEEMIDDIAIHLDCHLIVHSDCEGYYVPIDFNEVLFTEEDEDGEYPIGCMLGSSQRLLRELIYVAPYLDITLIDDQLPDTALAAFSAPGHDERPYWSARLVWLALFEAARISLANNTLISFG